MSSPLRLSTEDRTGPVSEHLVFQARSSARTRRVFIYATAPRTSAARRTSPSARLLMAVMTGERVKYEAARSIIIFRVLHLNGTLVIELRGLPVRLSARNARFPPYCSS
ncbi:hypothetical protein EVAR_35900_1 [Eumeta japonica]|uniref:Uncharacterized protein n=1 Tax=Eumeta variegata TaxID=151549 RepID=A0A4C1WTD4_EUMVA|nr:hypothetical protein EVAR_35900_1 [Eumeta japonica]